MKCPDCNNEIKIVDASNGCVHTYGKYQVYYCDGRAVDYVDGWINVYEKTYLQVILHLKKLILLNEDRIEKLMLLK